MRKINVLFSSGKTNSIPSQCEPAERDDGVASGATERIGESFCTGSTLPRFPPLFWAKQGLNIFQPNRNSQLAAKNRVNCCWLTCGQPQYPPHLYESYQATVFQLTSLILQDLQVREQGPNAQQRPARPCDEPSLNPAQLLGGSRAQPVAWPPPSPPSQQQPDCHRRLASLERRRAEEQRRRYEGELPVKYLVTSRKHQSTSNQPGALVSITKHSLLSA